MSILISLFMNSIVIASSFFIVYKLLNISNLVDSLICWFIFYFAQIVFTELLLGIFGILYLRNVILVNLILLAIIWLIVKDRESSFALKINALDFLKNKLVLFISAVILSFGLVKIGINLLNPPLGWDCLNYHFTFPVEWLKHANLVNPITVFDDPSPTYYPVNGSLFFLWFMLPLKNVFLADLAQVPFFVIGFLATYSISRKLKLNKELSFCAAALFLLIPNVFKQIEIAYVDMMVAALLLVCLIYLFLIDQKFSFKNILIFSLSFGLLVGTKIIGLAYGVLLFLPFLYICIRNIRISSKAIWLFLFSLLIIWIFGGFSYIRNIIETGNPLYPMDLKLWGKTIFKGVVDNQVYRAHFKAEDYKLTKLLFHEGLGAQTVIFILPFVFLSLPIALFKKMGRVGFKLGYFLILPLLIYLVYRYIIQLANVRYLYPLFATGLIAGFYSLTSLKFPARLLKILVFVCVLVSATEIAKHVELIISSILAFLFLFLLVPFIKYIQNIKNMLRKPAFIIVFLIFITCGLILACQYYIKNEYQRYIKVVEYSGFWPDSIKAWEWLNKNTVGNNIAYVGRPVPFPLYGSDFKNNVYYVSVNRIEPAKLHYFPNSRYSWGYDFLSLHRNLEAKGNYRSDADYIVWLENLKKRNIDYLFIYSLHQVEGQTIFPMEDAWAENCPEKFKLIFSNDTIHI